MQTFNGLVAQLVRAPPCHGGGRRFESDLGRLYGILAQLGEHLPYKQRVIGSSPARGVDGLVVKRLRHRPFTAVTRVRIPSRSFELFLTNSLQHDILIESCEFNIYGAVAKW